MAVAATRESPVRPLAETILRPYAQIIFSRDLVVGLLVLGAIASTPRLALATLAAVIVAAAVSLLFGLGLRSVREGGGGLHRCAHHAGPGHVRARFGIADRAASVRDAVLSPVRGLVSIGLRRPRLAGPCAAVRRRHMDRPPGLRRAMPEGNSILPLLQPAAWLPTSWLGPSLLDLPAALVFGHGQMTGLLMLLAILVHSRIGFLLAMLGAVAVAALGLWLRHGQPWSATDLTAAFNGMLAALAIGGVWFVPQPSSMILATASARADHPGVLRLVSAARAAHAAGSSRCHSCSRCNCFSPPRACESRIAGRVRRSRPTIPRKHCLGIWCASDASATWRGLPFRLPFRGEWFVSQGHDGEHTHQGLWRHGLDFEGRTPDGKSHTGDGKELRDYVCYGLPVGRARRGHGRAGRGRRGRQPTGRDEHARELGQRRRHPARDQPVLGVCAPATQEHPRESRRRGDPGHGHRTLRKLRAGRPSRTCTSRFSGSKLLGSSTIAFDFGDVVVRRNDELRLETHTVPDEGAFVRPAQRDDGLARSMSLTPGDVFDLTHKESERTERAKVDVNLAGERALVSPDARLVFDAYDNGLVFLDYSGSTESLLRFLLLAWARLPFDPSPRITWVDTLSRRLFMPRWRRAMADLWIVLVPEFGKLDVSYTSTREPGKVLVEGRAEAWTAKSVLSLSGGEHTITIHHGSTTSTIVMKKVEDDQGAKP